jgi:catechol 2,3-dioxygenase-like lactoylglutathione lyase family enzyme
MDTPTLIPEFKVTDFAKSLDFYTRIAGFKIEYQRPEDQFAMLSINGARLMIEALQSSSRTFKVGTLDHPFGRGMHLQIEVPDVQKLYDCFKAELYPLFVDMEERWYRRDAEEVGNRQFLAQDPDGYLLRFFQDLGSRPSHLHQ